jgi:hypothetical protein
MTQESKATLPRTPEEALQLVNEVAVPAATLAAWMNAVAAMPAGYAADLFISMRELLNAAIQRAATLHASGQEAPGDLGS